MMEESDIHPDVVSQEGILIYHVIPYHGYNAASLIDYLWRRRLTIAGYHIKSIAS